MSKILVYFFSKYDVINDTFITSKRPATRETIEKIGGSVIESTGKEVDANLLDEDGFIAKEHQGKTT